MLTVYERDFERRLGVLQLFVLAEMINCLGAYSLPLNLAYRLQKKN